MPVDYRTLSMSFTNGIDTKTDPKLVNPPYLTTLENGSFTRTQSIVKRTGYTDLGTAIFPTPPSSDITSGESLIGFEDELLLFDGSNMYSYTGSTDAWVNKGRHTNARVTQRSVVSGQYISIDAKLAVCGDLVGVAVKASIDGVTSLQATVYNISTGNVVVANHTVAAGINFLHSVGILGFGSRLMFLWSDPGTGRIKFSNFDCLGYTFSSAADLIGPITATKFAVAQHTSLRSILSYYDLAATAVKVVELDVSGLHSPATTLSPPVVFNPATERIDLFNYIHEPTDTLNISFLVGSLSTSELRSQELSLATLTIPTGFPQHIVIEDPCLSYTVIRREDDAATSFYTQQGFARDSIVTQSDLTYGAVAPPTLTVVGTYATGITVSPPGAFRYGGNNYIHAAGYLLDINADIIASIPRLGAPISIAQYAVDGFVSSYGVLSGLQFDAVTSQIVFGADQAYTNDTLNGVLYVGGGVVKQYDHSLLTELGFLDAPIIRSIDNTAAGNVNTGTHSYAVIYTWLDAVGRLHRSQSSNIFNIDNVGNKRVELSINTLPVTYKDRVRIEVYRTLANTTDVFLYVGSVENDATVPFITFVDDSADGIIENRAELYTIGGVLENDPAPRGTAIVAHKNRLFIVSDETETIWYSKLDDRSLGLGFNLQNTIQPNKEKPTALGALDDKIIVFEPRRTYAFVGDGPNNLGEQDTFTPIELITTDVGCSNQHSVERTNFGLMFKSEKGVFLLDRTLQAKYIGAPVEFYNDRFVRSSTLLPDTEEIRFMLDNGLCLVYYYDVDSWSVFTNHPGVRGDIWDGVYCYLLSNGVVRKGSRTIYTDAGDEYSLTIETAWIKLSGLQGFQRIRWLELLGDLYGAHDMTVQVGYDYLSSYTDTITFNSATVFPTPGEVYQFRARMPRQKCDAIRYMIADSSTSGNSYALSGLDLEVAVKRGLNRLRSEKTISST